MAQHAWVYPIEPALRLIVDVLRVGRDARAALEHDLHLRLPHPRGRLDGGAGTRVHARRRIHLCRARHRARARRRRVRAAALVLLGHPQRFLRGDRQAPRGAPDLGAPHEGALRREGSALVDDAVPLADRRRHAHRAAADEQHRARRVPGAGGGARRHAVAAHELDGRDARAADRSMRCRSRCARSRSSPTRPACRTCIDPLGGSYYVESLTDKLEREAEALFAEIDAPGRRGARRSRPGGSSARSPRPRRASSGRSSSIAA